MEVLIDTSALLAIVDAGDANHAAARTVWAHFLRQPTGVVVTNYVAVELMCLVQRRLGLGAVRTVLEDIVPALQVEWVSPPDHAAAVAAVLAAGRGDLSIVDCTSFKVMRRLGIEQAFAFDQHFADQGWRVIP